MTEEQKIYDLEPHKGDTTWEFMIRFDEDAVTTQYYVNKLTNGFYISHNAVGVYDISFLEALPTDLDPSLVMAVATCSLGSQNESGKLNVSCYKVRDDYRIRVVVEDINGVKVNAPVSLYARW